MDDENQGSKTAKRSLDDDWLGNFYRECGREVTLAYTTLNQMKNWAMVVVAAAVSGLSFGTGAQQYPNATMFVGVVIVYSFVLRFFIRAILCYINLTRWNTLQADCVEYKLLQKERPGLERRSDQETARKLRDDIQHFYFMWLSPIDRKTQLMSNLKLGFGLIFALPLFFLIWGAVGVWESQIVKGLTVFAVGTTIVELNDFLKSGFFDNVAAHGKRSSRKKFFELFPVPASRGWFLASWSLVLLLSILVAAWPEPPATAPPRDRPPEHRLDPGEDGHV